MVGRQPAVAEYEYSGSTEMTERPWAFISALKLAGPSAQPKIRPHRSPSERSNIAPYSDKVRPQGITRSMEKGMRGLRINSHGHRGLVYSDSSGVVGFAEERGTLVAVTFR